MNIITISRQMGSLGNEIAALTAQALNYRLLWKDLINQAAQRAGAPEVALAEIDELGLLNLKPSQADRNAYRKAVEQVITELALEGNIVLLGRAAQVILKDCTSALHVRIIAPLPLRIQRIADRLSIEVECAKAQVEASDSYRKRYLRRYYHCNWDDPDLYHLIINTASVPADRAARIIQYSLHCEKENCQ